MVPKSASFQAVLLVLFAFATRSTTLAEECPSHGCPILPLDIILNEKAHDALLSLRSVEEDENGNEIQISDEERLEALEVLLSAGDADKTTLTLQGNKGGPLEEQVNQDRAMIYSPYKVGGDSSPDLQAQLLGVFDGHGSKGEITSEFANTQIPKLLAEKLNSIALDDDEAVSQAIKDTFIEVDKTEPTKGEGGATATIVLQLGPKLFVANAGDSASFISILLDEEVEVVYQSREDKPDLPEEKARITEMGGYVHIPADPNEDVPRAYAVTEDGQVTHGVAMSRSIGDADVQGVIAEPIVDVLNVADIVNNALASYNENCKAKSEEEKKEGEAKETGEEEDGSESNTCEALYPEDVGILAVSASDGMMDFMKADEIAYIFAAAFFVEDNPHPHSASEYLILQAAGTWHQIYQGEYRDDIAVSAFKVFSNESIISAGSKASSS